MKWVNIAALLAVMAIVAGIPVYCVKFYPAQLARDQAAMEAMPRERFGKNAGYFFWARMDEEIKKRAVDPDHPYSKNAGLPRDDVRAIFRRYGASRIQSGNWLGMGRHPSDEYYWTNTFYILKVEVRFERTDHGIMYRHAYPTNVFIGSSIEERRFLNPLKAIWMLTLIVMGLRARAYLAERRKRRPPRPYQKAPASGKIFPWEKVWIALRWTVLAGFVAVIAFGGYLSQEIKKNNALGCRMSRARVFNTQSYYDSVLGERPRAQDLIEHFDESKERYLKACAPRCTPNGYLDPQCMSSSCPFPYDVVELKCPSGGRIYSGRDPGTILCSKHSEE